VISLQDVRLVRRTREEYSHDLKARVFALATGRYRKPRSKTVLDNITLSIAQGEKIGLIGANGAGKSTLLKLIAGILTPSSGTVAVNGRVAALIELGAGFDVELTVVDNIVRYGILLGLDRPTIEGRLEGILRFAELQEYRRYPVRALSSGMLARLGFAIATATDAKILLIDEALAVGDESFRAKSRARIDALWRADTTVVIVSHDLSIIRSTCDRTVWVDQGTIAAAGQTADIVDRYLRSVDRAAVEALISAGIRVS
jgi:ABC-type polysaccharide/polyol phosphate transport system ATPase subunit